MSFHQLVYYSSLIRKATSPGNTDTMLTTPCPNREREVRERLNNKQPLQA